MLDENKEKSNKMKAGKLVNDLLMKPFTLGWKREVVRRVITKNGTPNCDIYYFSPSGKKIRSLTEIKGNLPEDLSAECFSFKREPLGLDDSFETVRDAKNRRKIDEKTGEKRKTSRESKKIKKVENSDEADENAKENKKNKNQKKEDAAESNLEIGDKQNEKNAKPETEKIVRSRRAKQEALKPEETHSNRSKRSSSKKDETVRRGRGAKIRAQSVKKRKEVLKKVMIAKQAKMVAGKKILKKVLRKKAVASPKRKLSKIKKDKDGKKKKSELSKIVLKNSKNSLKNKKSSKGENAKDDSGNSESNKKSGTNDLQSIVRKNIGKYREMREKQKLGAVLSPNRTSQNRKIVVGKITRTKSEPISKNKVFYLKPFEKGWRREIVIRKNCKKASQQADVYYFHPNGKKLRSSREIAMNLTPDLPLECFTFRKEPIGCGEPCEIIRDARPSHKNQTVN